MIDLAVEPAEATQRKPWPSGIFSKLLEAGARMKEHSANGTISIHALQRTLCVLSQDLHEGQALTLAPGIKHDVGLAKAARFC
jgi:hypothetical protein